MILISAKNAYKCSLDLKQLLKSYQDEGTQYEPAIDQP